MHFLFRGNSDNYIVVHFTVWISTLSEQIFQGGASQSQEGANAPPPPEEALHTVDMYVHESFN